MERRIWNWPWEGNLLGKRLLGSALGRIAAIGVLVALGAAGATVARAQETPAPTPAPTPPYDVFVQSATPSAQRVAAPAGWLGIHYVCAIETWAKNGELFVKHSGYPLVAAVEPGSPADRAGIEAGDTIVAYNNEDINGRVLSLTKLLRPGSKLQVRIHRGNGSMDIPVVVARRTRYAPDVGTIAPRVRVEIDSEAGLARRMVIRSGTPRSMTIVTDPSTPVVAMAPLPPSPATAPALAWSSTTTALAGAELARITPDLGESFGVSHGVLVLSVGADTPAARARLRGGDVITRVDGTDVTTPLQVQRALQRAANEGVRLTIVRKKKTIEVPLTW